MLKVRKTKYLNSICVTLEQKEAIIENSILAEFDKPGTIESNYLEYEIEQYTKHLIATYCDGILIGEYLEDFKNCLTKLQIYETSS